MLFRIWLQQKGEEREILSIPPRNLDIYIASFIKNATYKTREGEERMYEPDSLTSMHRAIDRHLRENNYGFSMLDSPEFLNSRNTLKARRSELKGKGKGNRPNSAEVLTPEEEEKMWECQALNSESSDPHILQNTVWFWQQKFWDSGVQMKPDNCSGEISN